jgi:hypothetical protein
MSCPVSVTRRLLEPGLMPAWLPSGGVPLEGGTFWDLRDALTPERVRIQHVKHGADVRFEIEHPQWNASTEVSLSVRPRGGGAMLTFSHNGWEHLSGGDEYQKEQRRRFAALWIAALTRARILAASVDAGA